MREEGVRGKTWRGLCRLRAGHLEGVGDTAQVSPPMSWAPVKGQGRTSPLPRMPPPPGFGLHLLDSNTMPGSPGGPGLQTGPLTPISSLLGVSYLPSPARSCMVWVRVVTGEEAVARTGDTRRP